MNKTEILNEINLLKTDEEKADYVHSYIQKLEKEFEEFSDILTDRTEKIVSDVFEQDLGLDKEILRWSTLGRSYENWIDRFKGAICHENIADEEAYALLKAAKCEINSLRKNITMSKMATNIIKNDMRKMSKEIFVHQKLDETETSNISKLRIKKLLLEGETLNGLSNYEISKKIKGLLNENG